MAIHQWSQRASSWLIRRFSWEYHSCPRLGREEIDLTSSWAWGHSWEAIWPSSFRDSLIANLSFCMLESPPENLVKKFVKLKRHKGKQ